MMVIDIVFLAFALMHGIAFAVLANDYIDPFFARLGLKVGALIACSVKKHSDNLNSTVLT
jgi:hypothetical protein